MFSVSLSAAVEKFLQSVCEWYQSIQEVLKCTEPVEQNAYLFAFFYNDNAKFTKNNKKLAFCTKSIEQCSKKNVFF